MGRFLFVTSPFLGHINPTLSVGAELLQRGHDVIWLSLLDVPENVLPPGGQHDQIKPAQQGQDLSLTADEAFGINSLMLLYERVLIPLNEQISESISILIAKHNPDVIITDHQAFAGAIHAYKKNIPYATFVTAPAAVIPSIHFPKIIEWEEAQVVNLQHRLGLHLNKSIACSNQLTCVFSSTEFIGHSNFPANYKFVGPVLRHRKNKYAFDWDKFHRHSIPKILVTVGSIIKSDVGFLTKVIEAFSGLPVTVVVVADPNLINNWPDNFIVQEYIPQLEILPFLQAIVCHGGHNTVCESLYYGIPIVVMPMVNDQSLVATQIESAGCGIRLKYKRFNGPQLREAVFTLLRNSAYQEAAVTISNSFKNAGGTERTASLLEQLLLSTQIFTNRKPEETYG